MINAPDNVAVSRKLSKRQIEVLRLVAQGCSDAEIAERLSVVYGTVISHVAEVRLRLSLHNRVLLTLYALKAGVVSLDEIPLPGYEHL